MNEDFQGLKFFENGNIVLIKPKPEPTVFHTCLCAAVMAIPMAFSDYNVQLIASLLRLLVGKY